MVEIYSPQWLFFEHRGGRGKFGAADKALSQHYWSLETHGNMDKSIIRIIFFYTSGATIILQEGSRVTKHLTSQQGLFRGRTRRGRDQTQI